MAACTQGSREATLIESFFAAARLQDTSTLSSLSRVSFNPRVDGTVQRFAVTNIDRDRRDGSSVLEDVTVDAQVRTPEGVVQARRLVFTLERSPDGHLAIVGLR